jgi:mono/diheme cytochrome c family protein
MKTTKICHACGSQLPITEKLCRACGSALSKPSEAVSQPPTSSAQIESKQSSTQQAVESSSIPASSQPKNTDVAEKSSNTLVIIASVVAIAMVCGIGLKSESYENPSVGAAPAQTQAASVDAAVEQNQELSETNAGADIEWAKDDLLANGKMVYEKNCAACHQINGAGLPPAFPALTAGKITTGPIADQIALVLNGKNVMPRWKEVLNDVEIASVITYVRNALGNSVGDSVQPAQVKAAR